MCRSLFLRIEEAVTAHDNYFTQKTDVVGVRGLSSLKKVTAALMMLSYITAADAVDDYVRIGESTIIKSLKRFFKVIVEVFGIEYLRRLNDEDVARLLTENEQKGFVECWVVLTVYTGSGRIVQLFGKIDLIYFKIWRKVVDLK
ncbi:uncharacterized protein LOC141702196 [Apium graveolens]|uniref:uncharacterized protein LOC141702196 n=1 Tax=Apium graveolens TaxID=4045 RepID=UPI003D7A1229